MALLLYNALLLLLSPLIAIYLLVRLAKGKEDATHWPERWGRVPDAVRAGKGTPRPRFWVHAVSVGEVFAAKPVLRELRRRYPEALIVLSTTTPSGREVAQKEVPPADAVIYYPLDVPFAVRRALRAVRPDAVLLMEWEVWPNFLTAAKRLGARVAVLNGRISDRGLRRGERPGARLFTAPGLAAVDLFAMQSAEDARRAPRVGADPARVQAFGNTKFDESPAPVTAEEREALRADLGLADGAPVWVCGSTRDAPKGAPGPDEEALIADAYRRARQSLPDLQLILAPRHLDRADAIVRTLEAAGFRVCRRSRREPLSADHDGGRPTAATEAAATEAAAAAVLLLDTFGELAKVYAIADVAFVGGSLVRQGGQSVFQPLAQGVPALFGPYMNNQRDIAALAQEGGVGFTTPDAEALAAEVVRLVRLPESERVDLRQRARALIERNQGVTARCVDAVAQLLDTRAATTAAKP